MSPLSFVSRCSFSPAGGAGRTVRTEYAGATGASESFFNDLGQLERTVDPDGNTVWYEYNAKGELETTVVDVDGDETKEINGPDRVTRTDSDYTTLSGGSWNGVAVRRGRTWQKNDANQEVLVGERWTSVDGRRSASWSTVRGARRARANSWPGLPASFHAATSSRWCRRFE